MTGQVLHWGQLDGSSFAPYRPASSPVPPLAHPGSTVATPMKLGADIPPITRLLAGRRHVLAVAESGEIWTWANWAEVGRLRDSWVWPRTWKLVDLTAGWDVSACLMEMKANNTFKGRQVIRVWWQRFMAPSLRTVDTLGAPGPDRVPGRNGCYFFSPSQVVTLPDLPVIDTDSGPETQKIVKIAAGEEFLIILTEQGRVFKMDLSFPPPLPAEDGQGGVEEDPPTDDGTLGPRRFAEFEAMFINGRRTWEYMDKFSTELGSAKINHISASFRTFFAIGEGRVLQGQREMSEHSEPIIMPSLQKRGVIR